jgi:hypothetical protein
VAANTNQGSKVKPLSTRHFTVTWSSVWCKWREGLNSETSNFRPSHGVLCPEIAILQNSAGRCNQNMYPDAREAEYKRYVLTPYSWRLLDEPPGS